MKWPWTKDEPRPCLRIFADGKAILTLPKDVSERQAHEAGEAISNWMALTEEKAGLVIVPFPIDIFDERPKPAARGMGFGR